MTGTLWFVFVVLRIYYILVRLLRNKLPLEPPLSPLPRVLVHTLLLKPPKPLFEEVGVISIASSHQIALSPSQGMTEISWVLLDLWLRKLLLALRISNPFEHSRGLNKRPLSDKSRFSIISFSFQTAGKVFRCVISTSLKFPMVFHFVSSEKAKVHV